MKKTGKGFPRRRLLHKEGVLPCPSTADRTRRTASGIQPGARISFSFLTALERRCAAHHLFCVPETRVFPVAGVRESRRHQPCVRSIRTVCFFRVCRNGFFLLFVTYISCGKAASASFLSTFRLEIRHVILLFCFSRFRLPRSHSVTALHCLMPGQRHTAAEKSPSG